MRGRGNRGVDFIEIAVTNINGEAAEAVSELFNRYGHGGAVMETYPPHFDKVTVRTVIPSEDELRLREIEALLTLIGQALPSGLPAPQFQAVGKSDWASSWKEHFHVVRVGQRFVIKPSWREYTPTDDDIIIEIDPGLAFGSGLHPTTQLCLKIFEQMPLEGQSLFDVGSGSGILSLAALKLGAGPVRAVDVDEVAVRVAQENFERNGYPLSSPPPTTVEGSFVETAVGSAADTGGRPWQIVVANILAHILVELMSDLATAVAPGGQLILSGMIAEQEAEVTAAAMAQNLHVIGRHTQEDWVALVVGRDE
jgi:ribosomal protein L11 methyltransferase